MDITPDPRVLVALTYTPLSPLDALSELIDNAIDSLKWASMQGQRVEFPLISVEVPGRSEVTRGEGRIRVRDNGPRMSADEAQRAITAGYSSNNPYDSLGLFGMGFNISTGKSGRRTRVLTAKENDDKALEVVVDLPKMQEAKTYHVPDSLIDKPGGLRHGTIVEIDQWWPKGHKNRGVIEQLASYGAPTIRRELGRRYATLIREGVRLTVNREPVSSYEHCVWGDGRYVERKGHGQIPAIFHLNHVVALQKRCADCYALVPEDFNACPECRSPSFRTIEERVKGWLGVQRFDNETNFGIDVIHNGRAILIAEKPAFFEWENEFRTERIRDYPIDQTYGRIVGEIHLDHVPVDFMRQDFQRASEEWVRAIAHIRGASSLQPTQPGADRNTSPLFKLYQGYRKVRNPGRADMYMGYWDTESRKPKRISRAVEKEYYEHFLAGTPGFKDDSEWWKLVEGADQPPPEPLLQCPNCSAENLQGVEECAVCGHVLLGQVCLNEECGQIIAQSAATCPHCATSQVPEVAEPWKCAVCGHNNGADAESCTNCTRVRGTPSPASREYLVTAANKSDELSLAGASVELADGSRSAPVDVAVYTTQAPLVPVFGGANTPLIAFRGDAIEIFIDPSHPMFRAYRVRPEVVVAVELGQYIYDQHRSLLRPALSGLHTLPMLVARVLDNYSEVLEDSPDRVRSDVAKLFELVKGRLPALVGPRAEDIYADLTETEQRGLVGNLIGLGQDVGQLAEWRRTGEYLAFVPPDTVVSLFGRIPELFFDGAVWEVPYADIGGLTAPVLAEVQEEPAAKYMNCLQDCAAFLRYNMPDPATTFRARASVDYLSAKLV